MAQSSILEGTKKILQTISVQAIIPDMTRSISLEDISFPTSYDVGPDRVVVPGSPPVWTPPQELPISIPIDSTHIDPRTVLPGCPVEQVIRAIEITVPDLALREFDLITDRKNLRALFNFFTRGIGLHRIDAEIVGDTLLFHLGWSAGGYEHRDNSYGMSFETSFTGPLSEGTIRHNRVISYTFGGLKTLVRYQVDACLSTAPSTQTVPPLSDHMASTTISPSGLQIIRRGITVPAENVIEIKTLLAGYRPTHDRTMTQLWFSQTPIIMAGYHDGRGRFSSIEKIDVKETGALDLWQIQNTATLQKVVRLIGMIKEHMTASICKRQAIVLESRRSGRYGLLKFYELESNAVSLPNDLRQKLV